MTFVFRIYIFDFHTLAWETWKMLNIICLFPAKKKPIGKQIFLTFQAKFSQASFGGRSCQSPTDNDDDDKGFVSRFC